MSVSVVRRLLLVSTNYAPEHAGIGPYATQTAEHWAEDPNCEVHVLTGLPHYPAWRVDPGYQGVWRATGSPRLHAPDRAFLGWLQARRGRAG